MISEAELTCLIEADGSYNFRELVDQYGGFSAKTYSEHRLLNTLELFAFGGCSAYGKNRARFIELSEKSKRKLVMLSVLSVMNGNVGNSVAFEEVLRVVHPLVTDFDALEQVVILMVDCQAVSVRIDEEKKTLRVMDTPVLRDAYNEGLYKLRVLGNDDLLAMPVGRARDILRKWLDEKIVPARQELDG